MEEMKGNISQELYISPVPLAGEASFILKRKGKIIL